jgi:hypothetical protein
MKRIETPAGNTVLQFTGEYYRHSRPQRTKNTQVTENSISLDQKLSVKKSFGVDMSTKTTEKAAAATLKHLTNKTFKGETIWRSQLAR